MFKSAASSLGKEAEQGASSPEACTRIQRMGLEALCSWLGLFYTTFQHSNQLHFPASQAMLQTGLVKSMLHLF